MRTAALAAALAAALGIASCANPGTTVRVDPVSRTIYLYDTKDNGVELRGLVFKNSDGTEFRIDSFTLSNNASDVRRANAEQVRAVNEGWYAFAALAQQVMPYLPGLMARPATSSGISFNPTTGAIGLDRTSTPAPPATVTPPPLAVPPAPATQPITPREPPP